MALSKQVEESLDEVQASLRNALAFAARNERPIVNQAIADLMCNVDKLKSVDKNRCKILYEKFKHFHEVHFKMLLYITNYLVFHCIHKIKELLYPEV